jgi:hypothetical protein
MAHKHCSDKECIGILRQVEAVLASGADVTHHSCSPAMNSLVLKGSS